MEPFPYKKLVVIGTTSSGKSTLAERLANKLGLEFIELDALNWGPNWTAAGDETLRARAEQATRSPNWVVAGNYSATRPVTWPRAEAVIWLDYSLWVIFWRLFRRTWKRVFFKEELWNGNQEHLSIQLKLWSEESLFHWLFKTYWRRKRGYPQLFALPEHAHLKVIHFNTPQETEVWMENIEIKDQANVKALLKE
ncbi:MAG: AAA family ATPase [Anaerolineales bacterium]